jgi:hypothetical protein
MANFRYGPTAEIQLAAVPNFIDICTCFVPVSVWLYPGSPSSPLFHEACRCLARCSAADNPLLSRCYLAGKFGDYVVNSMSYRNLGDKSAVKTANPA